MLHSIACIAVPQMAPFEFGVICEVFGIDRSEQGGPTFDFHVVAAEPGPIPTKLGFDVVVHEGLEFAYEADLVAVPASLIDTPPDERVLDVIRHAVERGAWVLSVCSGAFTLGHAGVLAGRRATTHWNALDLLASLDPTLTVERNVRFVEDGILSSAGVAAGIDMTFQLVARLCGQAVAEETAHYIEYPWPRGASAA